MEIVNACAIGYTTSNSFAIIGPTVKRFITILLIILFFLVEKPAYGYTFTEKPTKIVIPTANISLPVYEAKVAFNTWEVRTDGASHGEYTPLPGNPGNMVIFSHALPWLFESLPRVKKDDYIHVFTKHDWFVYRAVETMVVDPENTEVIFSGDDQELTLYTCTGFGYTQRFVVKAKPAFNLR